MFVVLLSEYLSQEGEDKQGADGDVKEDGGDNLDEEDDAVDDSNSAMLQDCFSTITDTLSKNNPQ